MLSHDYKNSLGEVVQAGKIFQKKKKKKKKYS